MQYKESAVSHGKDTDNMAIAQNFAESGKLHMTGEIIDEIYRDGKLVDRIVGHNLIVNSAMKLVMALLKGESGYSRIQYWAIGSGLSSWGSNPPDPEINATRLTNEIGRVAIAANEIVFLDADFNISSNPTNILRIKHTFGANDCNGEWREFGLFGGNATASANTGMMINKKHHAVITKTSDMTIDRTMRFTLNLV